MEVKRPQILIVENSKAITGAFKSILLYSIFLKRKFEFHWVIPKDSKIKKELIKHEYRIFEIPFLEVSRRITILWYFPRLIINAKKILKIASNNKADVIHFNDIYNMVGIIIKWIDRRKKVVYHIRLLPSSYLGKFFYVFRYFVRKKADEIIVVSTAVAKYFDSHYSLIHDVAIPPDNFTFNLIQTENINIIYVGAVMPGKGQDMALNAFIVASPKNPKLRILFVGSFEPSDPYYNSLQELVKHHQLSDKVSFIGFAENPYLYMHKAHIALNFSKSESFSMTCLEAALCGIPVIATNSGGPTDIVIESKTGFLIPNNNIDKAIEKILLLANDSNLRNSMGEQAKKYVSSKFMIKDLASKLSGLYYNLIDGS